MPIINIGFCYDNSESQFMAVPVNLKVNLDFCWYYACFFITIIVGHNEANITDIFW